MRQKSSAVAAATAALLGLASSTSGAAAAGSCSIVAPTKVVMDQSYEPVPLRLASNCLSSGTAYASWDIYHPSEGFTGIAIFDGNFTDTWDLYDWDGAARYQVRPSAAYDDNFDDVTQNTAYITVKLGARLTATTSRSNGQLRFNAYARTYSPNASDWYKRAGAKVSLFYKAPGSSTWSWVKSANTDSAGRVGISVAPKYGSYRLMIPETDRVWASYSATVRGK